MALTRTELRILADAVRVARRNYGDGWHRPHRRRQRVAADLAARGYLERRAVGGVVRYRIKAQLPPKAAAATGAVASPECQAIGCGFPGHDADRPFCAHHWSGLPLPVQAGWLASKLSLDRIVVALAISENRLGVRL